MGYALRAFPRAHFNTSTQEAREPAKDLHLSTADQSKVGFHPWLNIRSARWLRFESAPTGERIRAVQGHSVDVDLGHPTLEPPFVLFHGTAVTSWPAISTEGLKRGTRHAVHLSVDVATAKRVGARHGRPVVLEVAAAQMHKDGFQFSRSDNDVWLVSAVPPRYLKLRS